VNYVPFVDQTEARNNSAVKKGAPDGFDAACRRRRRGATTACEDKVADALAGAVPLSDGEVDPLRSIGGANRRADD
jgi:hypothetical protein